MQRNLVQGLDASNSGKNVLIFILSTATLMPSMAQCCIFLLFPLFTLNYT